MLTFLKSFFGKADSLDSELAGNIASVANGLDIDMAMAAHENWKIRLQAYLEGTSTEEFSAEEICFDDRCDLGQWIHGPGKARLGTFPGFTALMGHHKMFHYAASNVVALAKVRKETEALAMLAGQFSKYSGEVMEDLTVLQALVDSAASRNARSSVPRRQR